MPDPYRLPPIDLRRHDAPLFRRGRLTIDLPRAVVYRDVIPESLTCYVKIGLRSAMVGTSYVWDGFRLTAAAVQAPGAPFPLPDDLIREAEGMLRYVEDGAETLSLALGVTIGRDARVTDHACPAGRGLLVRVVIPALEFDAVVDCERAIGVLRPLADARPSEIIAALRGCEVT